MSESRVKRVLRHPKRVEEGIALDTVACMQAVKPKDRKFSKPGSTNFVLPGKQMRRRTRGEEIWVMFQIKNEKRKIKNYTERKKIIISAWRYPGISPVGKKIEIPQDVLEDLKQYTDSSTI